MGSIGELWSRSKGAPFPRVGQVPGTPVLGFEPRSEAPQASRIIQCSGARFAASLRSYPTRAPVAPPTVGARPSRAG
jgi:hypothetical protein